MSFRFTILNNRTNTEILIDEPVGWDKNKIKITRDPEWHGVFFSRQGDEFIFEETAETILKAEYDEYGVQGDMSLIIEEDCGNGFEFFDKGNFLFKYYYHSSGQDCYVKIIIDQSNDMGTIRNRMDQKVNLETDRSFDETTALVPYAKLSFPVVLPSRGIFIQDEFINDKEFTTLVQGVPENDNPGTDGTSTNTEMGMIEIGFDNQKSAEIGFASSLSQSFYSCVLTAAGFLGCASFDRFYMSVPGPYTSPDICPLQTSPYVNFANGSPNYDAVDNPCNIEIVSNGRIEVLYGTINYVWFVVAVLPVDKVGNADADYIYLSKQLVYEGPGTGLAAGNVLSLNKSYSNPAFNLNKGDRIYAFYTLYNTRVNSAQGPEALRMTFDAGNYFKLTNISHTPPSISNLFAINECFSRVTEAITDDLVKVKSDYFGRTDSEPYASMVDGPGSLEAITDGLRIRRQENKIPGQPSIFAQSLKDLFAGARPIHNIGAGLEPDTVRGGDYNWLRIEPWKFFYRPEVIMSCTNVKVINRSIYEKEIYSTFNFGFQKWEAEQYNGLDEFLTKRVYRTTIKEVNNALTQYSTFIGSGFAWEITRRIGNNDSKDWRYDKETFIACLKRGGDPFVLTSAFGSALNTVTVILDYQVFIIGHDYQITGTASNNNTQTVLSITPIGGNAYIIFLSGPAIVNEFGVDATYEDVTPGLLSVEQGNVTGDVNIIDPSTLYNYRISPVRNAMRWMNNVMRAYRKFDTNSKLIFTDGDGNYFAEGEMTSLANKIENQVIAENVTITAMIYKDIADAKPFLLPERVIFEYPMYGCDYQGIKANPGGRIYFENECDKGYGYIDEIIYMPDDAKANFTLKPAITEYPCWPAGLVGTPQMPDAVVGEAYNFQFDLTGDAPFTLNIITKPDWMTITIVGRTVFFTSGAFTPTDPATDVQVDIEIENCGGIAQYFDLIDVLAAPGDIEFTCMGGSIDPIPFGVAGTYNWTVNIVTTTPGRVHIIAHNNQVGSLNGFAIYFEGDMIIGPGDTTLTIPLQYDGGGINTFNNLIVESIDLSGSSICDDFLISYD